MFFPEIDQTYCPARIVKETILFGNRVSIHENEIPVQGCCSLSSTEKEPCQYLYPEGCSRSQRQDLCDFDWARLEVVRS